ncbi:MAG TPA: hypothetical protein VIL09_12475 [Microvirga sp.]|jgi:hypothetical protein
MISVLVRVEHGVEALAVTLSALVPAVADGLVGDAVVLVRRPDEAVARVADAVGAGMVTAEGGAWRDGDAWREGARRVRRDWVLCLADGDVPSEGWIRTLDRFIALSPPERRFGRLARPSRPLRERLLALVRPRAVRPGDLVHRALLLEGVASRPVRVPAAIERDPVFG